MRIKQAVAKVNLLDGRYFWIRLSRCYMDSLITYWRNYNGFHYLKIYEIVNYRRTKKGSIPNHQIGNKIGFITLKSSDFSLSGLYEKPISKDYQQYLSNKIR